MKHRTDGSAISELALDEPIANQPELVAELIWQVIAQQSAKEGDPITKDRYPVLGLSTEEQSRLLNEDPEEYLRRLPPAWVNRIKETWTRLASSRPLSQREAKFYSAVRSLDR